MLETARLCWLAIVALATACAAPAPPVAQPQPGPPPVTVEPVRDEAAFAAEAKAMLAQAETDVQRARAKRALWLKAWEDLLSARRAAAANDHASVIRHAKQASELAQLGLEQLAYPAVK